MKTGKDLKFEAMMAARDNGIASMMFRNTMAKKFGLTLTESVCLTLLGVKGSSTPKELSRFTGLTSGSVTTMLDRLAKRGFIVRKANTSDRRGVLIELTDKYNHEAQKMVAGIQKANLELFSSFDDEQLKLITDFLNRFTNNMQQAAKEIEADN